MEYCQTCIKTIKAEHGEMSVNICQMIGTCICHNDVITEHSA